MNIFPKELYLQKVQTLHSSYDTRTILQFAKYFPHQQPYLLFCDDSFKSTDLLGRHHKFKFLFWHLPFHFWYIITLKLYFFICQQRMIIVTRALKKKKTEPL